MLSEERQIQMHEDTGNNHIAWEIFANNLLVSSNVIKKQRDRGEVDENGIPYDIQILFPEIMLRGFAVECLLKALWVKRGEKLVSDGEYKGIPGASDHNLLQLADVNGINLTKSQRDVLKRISLIMVSFGRYPIPKKWIDNKTQKLHPSGKGRQSYWMDKSDSERLEGIIREIQKCLEEK